MTEPTYLAAQTLLQQRYEIGAELGRGGYSVVYRARDRRIGSDVAVKLLVPPPASAKLARERLRREVQAMRQLSHPNIVTAYDVVDEGPWSFVVMELVDGPDLAVHVRRRGPLDTEAAVRLGREISGALDAAHRRGILHRDVKPQNILIAPDGRARLTDFGSVRLAGQDTVTQTGALVGTPDYASPEVRAGARGDARSDEYALGVTLFYALTGELPITANRAAEGLHPRARRPDVPDWLDAIVARATMSDPDLRFPAVRLLGDALEQRDRGSLSPATVSDKSTCVLCHAPEPFGMSVCPGCARQGDAGRNELIFVTGQSARNALDALLGKRTSRGARDAAARGERAVLRLPSTMVARAIDMLEARGLPARAEPGFAAWRCSVPGPIAALATIVAAGGIAAGFAAATPLLFLTSPAFALLLAGAAAFGRRTPIWEPRPGSRPALPPDATRAVVQAFATLPGGHARTLTADVVRRATSTPAAAERAGALIVAACGAATELAALEQHLAAFDMRRDRLSQPPAGWLDALSRCERGRDLLTQRLLETSAALSSWQAAQATNDAVRELAQELEDEGQRQAEAAREVAELLNPA